MDTIPDVAESEGRGVSNGNGSWLSRHILALLGLVLALTSGVITGMLAQARAESSIQARVEYLRTEQAKRITREEFQAVIQRLDSNQRIILDDMRELKTDVKQLLRSSGRER